MPPLDPMLAKAAPDVPDDAEASWRYEPKWDGFRCIVYRDGDDVALGSRSTKPLTRYFPEMVAAVKAALPPRCVLDGELVVTGPHGLDWDALGNRIHPAESRINRLAAETPSSLVAFDLLAIGDEDCRPLGFDQRRAFLESVLDAVPSGDTRVHLTPITSSADEARDWFERFEGAGLDGVVAKRGDLCYRPGERAMVKVKHERTADCVVAGYRLHKSGDGPGSLLLGLYDNDGTLHHVGVASSFSAARRKALVAELEPWATNTLDGHPWAGWIEAQTAAVASGARLPGGVSRWTGTKDLSWVPLKMGLVAEVSFTQLQGDPSGSWGPPARFRATARFKRWRPDREPESCRYDQLDVAPPIELRQIFAAGQQ
jgi:ATP-dependent DNA ligase